MYQNLENRIIIIQKKKKIWKVNTNFSKDFLKELYRSLSRIFTKITEDFQRSQKIL